MTPKFRTGMNIDSPIVRTPIASMRNRPALPPGPRLPDALQAVGWVQRPLAFLERCQRRYGDVFTLRVRHGGTWVILADPEDVKRVFTADPRLLGVAEANPLLGPLLGRSSVMLREEPEHMARRRALLPPFHGGRIESWGEAIAEVARAEVARWPMVEPFSLWPQMQEITLQVVMRVVFGSVETVHQRRLREQLGALTECLNDARRLWRVALLGPHWLGRDARFRAAMDSVEDAVLEEVRIRRVRGGSPDRTDIATLLAEACGEDGSPLSSRELRDELVTLLLDGPTSTSLAWVLERLLRHPDKLARVREEIDAGGEEPYLDAVVKETLRLCPPVAIVARRLLAPMRLGGRTLPAGTAVAPCIHLVHRRANVYREPRRFLPERFLDRPPGTYTWIPFGGGVRRCLAASFALLEMRRVVRTVLAEVELRPVDPRSEQVRRAAISFSPDRRGLVIATRRSPVRRRTDGAAELERAGGPATCAPAA